MASLTRRTVSSRTRRRDEIRNRILVVVEERLAAGESFTELSVERIVSLAGVSRSTFYVYFEDKGQLLRAWLTDITEDLDDAAMRWWNLSPEASYDDLEAALRGVVDAYHPHLRLMSAAFDAAAYDPSVREAVLALMAHNTAGLRKHIRDGQHRGFVDATLAAAEVAEWLTWMAERGLHQLIRDAEDSAIDRHVAAYTSIVWNTLYAPARSATAPSLRQTLLSRRASRS